MKRDRAKQLEALAATIRETVRPHVRGLKFNRRLLLNARREVVEIVRNCNIDEARRMAASRTIIFNLSNELRKIVDDLESAASAIPTVQHG